MKNIHFFGCSFTAGDELTDQEFFPWKFTEEHTPHSYYEKRNQNGLRDNDFVRRYFAANKKLAYPSHLSYLNNSKYKVFNHAVNGISLRENIYNLMSIVESGLDAVDAVYFQPPPIGRELYVKNTANTATLDTVTVNTALHASDHYDYVMAKLKIIHPLHYILDSVIDIILVSGYLESKNIYYKFIDLGYGFSQHELNELSWSRISLINGLTTKYTNLPKLDYRKFRAPEYMLLGGHMNLQAHWELARELQRDLEINLK